MNFDGYVYYRVACVNTNIVMNDEKWILAAAFVEGFIFRRCCQCEISLSNHLAGKMTYFFCLKIYYFGLKYLSTEIRDFQPSNCCQLFLPYRSLNLIDPLG